MGSAMDILRVALMVASTEELMVKTWVRRKVGLMVHMKAENLEHKMAVYSEILQVVHWGD